MDLNECCDRTPDLKHSDDFQEYYFECRACNYKSSNRENPQDAAKRWNIEKPNSEHSINNYKSKYPKEKFIEVAEHWANNDELESCDIDFDNPTKVEKRSDNKTVYVQCWIQITEDEVQEFIQEQDDDES